MSLFEGAKHRLKEEAEVGFPKEFVGEEAKAKNKETHRKSDHPCDKCVEACEIEENDQGASLYVLKTGNIWAVGGAGLESVVVHAHRDTRSAMLGRLASGARIEEVQRVENRLQYKKICGDGPDVGWVHIRCNRKCVLKRETKGKRVFGGTPQQ